MEDGFHMVADQVHEGHPNKPASKMFWINNTLQGNYGKGLKRCKTVGKKGFFACSDLIKM